MVDAAPPANLAAAPEDFPLPPPLLRAPRPFADAIARLTNALLDPAAAPPAARTKAAAFLARLFSLDGVELAAVALAYRREKSADHTPELHTIATECGLHSKQALRAVLSRAVSRCPEPRALFRSLSVRFDFHGEQRLFNAMLDGATFPGVLTRTAAGFLQSPVASLRGEAVFPYRPRTATATRRRAPLTSSGDADSAPGEAPRSARKGPGASVVPPDPAPA